MAGSTITQRIALEGAEQIKQALSQIGKVGQEAFAQIQAAGENVKLEKPFGAVDTAASRAGTSIDTMRVRVSNASGAFGAARTAAQGLGDQVGNAASAMSGAQRAGAALANVVLATGGAMRGVGSAVAAGSAHFTNLNFGVTSVAGAFRNAIGEVLKTTGALAALPATLFALAKSASSTAGEIRNSALAAGVSTTAYQEFAGAAGKLGSEQEQLGQAFAVIASQSGEVQHALVEADKTNTKFARSGSHSVEEMSQHYRDLRERVSDAGGAFERYGIALTQSGGKARDPIEVFKEVADQIAAIPDPADRAARAVELFGRKVGPDLLPFLSKGAEGIERIGKQLQSQGLILTPTQIGVGVEMKRAVGQLQFSITRLKDSIGLLFAPQFTEAANLFRKAITDSRSAVITFAADVATKTRPIFLDLARAISGQDKDVQTGWILTAKTQLLEFGAAVSTVVTTVVLPVLKTLAGLMKQVANGINAVFGTKITPADIVVTLVITKLIGGFLSLLGVLTIFRGAWGLLVGLFAALGGPLTIVLTIIRVLGGVFATVAGGAIGLVAAAGGLPLLLAAVGAALGFLAVKLAQGINWKKLSDGAAAVVRSIVGFFTGLWVTVSGLFSTRIAAIAGLWAGITNAALTVWTSIAAGAGALWIGLMALWQSGSQRIQEFWNSIIAGATSLWGQLTAMFQAGFELLSGGWAVIVAATQAVFGALKSLAQGVWNGIVSGAQGMWDTITGAFSSGVNAVIGFLTRVRDIAISVWNAITGAAQGAASAQESAAAAGATGFARGGPIHGPGTATSDSVPIWASAGEFMVRAAAVRKYGVSIFHALNAMRLPKGAFRGFSQGGLIDRLQVMMPPMTPLRFADGGQIPALVPTGQLRPLNLQIGPELFAGLLAPEDVAQKLLRVAVARQIRSAGRKPGYV
jgi:hypothetical protein